MHHASATLSQALRHSSVGLTASLLVACGGAEPTAMHAPTAHLSPPSSAKAPLAPEVAAVPPAQRQAPVGAPTSCRLEPAGGTVVIADRRAPRARTPSFFIRRVAHLHAAKAHRGQR